MTTQMLTIHFLEAGCAVPIPSPARRYHSSYRPINKTSDDPNIPDTPRRTPRSLSPRKRSGSRSPVKAAVGAPSEAIVDTPTNPPFNPQDAQRFMSNFKAAAESQSDCCAVTGQGRGWSNSMVVGPGMHACHIVPASSWDLYPLREEED